MYGVANTCVLAFGEPYWWRGWVCFRNIGMDYVLLAIAADEATAQLVHRRAQDLEPFVVLREDLLERFDFELQRVQTRHRARPGEWMGRGEDVEGAVV